MTRSMTSPECTVRRNAKPSTIALWLFAGTLLVPQLATAQDKGTLNPQPLPPLAHPEDPSTPAKELFGRKAQPAKLETRTIGFYSKGCLAGAMLTMAEYCRSILWLAGSE